MSRVDVVRSSTVPVIETGTGNCHVYVDATADLGSALEIALNSKTQRTSVCNAAETVLVHAAVADAFLPPLLQAMASAGVRLHGDDAVRAAAEGLAGVEGRAGDRRGLGHRVPGDGVTTWVIGSPLGQRGRLLCPRR